MGIRVYSLFWISLNPKSLNPKSINPTCIPKPYKIVGYDPLIRGSNP